MKHIHGLNALRAFAVAIVLVAHFGFWFDYTSPSGRFISRILIPGGGFGVRLFFVLSGFLITSILLKAKSDVQDRGPMRVIGNFFARRSLRIFPLYYLVMLILWATDATDIRTHFGSFATYTSNLLFRQQGQWSNMGHTWSLAVEEQFYLGWPWFIIFISNKYLKYFTGVVILVGIASNYVSISVMSRMPLLVTDAFDSLGLGGAYALACHGDRTGFQFARIVKIIAPSAVALYFYALLAGEYGWHQQVPYYVLKVNESVVALWLVVLVCGAKSMLVCRYLLDARPLEYIGKISYGIYLFHGVYLSYCYSSVAGFFQRIAERFPAVRDLFLDRHSYYWLHIGIVIMVSAVSFRFFEAPLLRLKDKFR